MRQNDADVLSLKKVQESKSLAYTNLKNTLGITNPTLLNYIKANLIRKYNGNNLAINLSTPEAG